MDILVTCKMDFGTLPAKIRPLSNVNRVNKIYVLRSGDYSEPIKKVVYLNGLQNFHDYTLIRMIMTPIYMFMLTKRFNIDLILSYHVIPYGVFAFLVSKLTGIPYNVSITGTLIHSFLTNKTLIGRFLIKVINQSIFINVPGHYSKKMLVSKNISPRKIKILHSTVDPNQFYPRIHIKKIYDIIFIGRLEREKRLKLFIDVVNNISKQIKIQTLIVGKGSLRDYLIKYTEECKLTNEIKFIDFTEDVSTLYNKGKVFVLCSKMEALSLSVMEAMASGLPVVAPNIGDLSMAIKHEENGVLIEDINVNTYSDVIIELLLNKNKYREYSRNSRKHILKNHSDEVSTRKWNQICNTHFHPDSNKVIYC